ncbi:uncharacterized protein LOC124286980 [Haliotis rubra]|uniref:uncharacterized protein LOC124286980 n=1 Tax=Haliotis rubra TaxID=36100 RepID=UPI001EE5A53F|nr:uncharacterized protein LOC124286980 [Haliotis rubra]
MSEPCVQPYLPDRNKLTRGYSTNSHPNPPRGASFGNSSGLVRSESRRPSEPALTQHSRNPYLDMNNPGPIICFPLCILGPIICSSLCILGPIICSSLYPWTNHLFFTLYPWTNHLFFTVYPWTNHPLSTLFLWTNHLLSTLFPWSNHPLSTLFPWTNHIFFIFLCEVIFI